MKIEATPAQIRVLYACQGINLDEGRIELSMQTGMSGAALEKSINACLRRGWIAEDGWTSDKGEGVLNRHEEAKARYGLQR